MISIIDYPSSWALAPPLEQLLRPLLKLRMRANTTEPPASGLPASVDGPRALFLCLKGKLMISLFDRASFDDAAFLCRETVLQHLLLSRIAALVRDGHDLSDLTQILIVQAGDSEQDVVEEIGLSPLINPIDGCRYGEPQFNPWWDWLQEASGWCCQSTGHLSPVRAGMANRTWR